MLYMLDILTIKLSEMSNHLSQWNIFQYKLLKNFGPNGSTISRPYPSLAGGERHIKFLSQLDGSIVLSPAHLFHS